MTNNDKKKRQHYVPVSYLRRFSSGKNKLWVFDKFEGKSFETNIDNVACGTYFYDFREDISKELGIPPQIMENALGEIEADYSLTINAILSKSSARRKRRNIISQSQKSSMAYFVAAQFLRTQEFRELAGESETKLLEAVINELDQPEASITFQLDDDRLPILQAEMIFNPEKIEAYANALHQHIWLIGINNIIRMPFYTSDHPVARRSHQTDPLRSNAGLGSKSIEIALPLDSEHILVMLGRERFGDYEKLDCKSLQSTLDNVTYYNSMQVVKSYRYVYCATDNFDLVRRICKDNPKVCSPDRERVQVV